MRCLDEAQSTKKMHVVDELMMAANSKTRAVDASQRIREIIARMTHITKVQASGSFPGVPAMLDIHRSSEDN